MRRRSLLAALTVAALMAGTLAACEQHPRQDEEQQDQPEGSSQVAAQDTDAGGQDPAATTDQAREEGSELARHTSGQMEDCIQVVGRVMHCTTVQPFNELVLEDGVAGLTAQELQRRAKYWQEPGAQRQTCRQLFEAQTQNPFQDEEALSSLADSTNVECVDFGQMVLDNGAMEALANTNI